jgi:hypothetical protein
METLVVKVNLFLIVDGIEIDLNVTNLTLQIKWKFKGGQAQCEFILNIGD